MCNQVGGIYVGGHMHWGPSIYVDGRPWHRASSASDCLSHLPASARMCRKILDQDPAGLFYLQCVQGAAGAGDQPLQRRAAKGGLHPRRRAGAAVGRHQPHRWRRARCCRGIKRLRRIDRNLLSCGCWSPWRLQGLVAWPCRAEVVVAVSCGSPPPTCRSAIVGGLNG